ncbi:MAG: hypothetical protein NT098_01435 [Candidatus Parcubacteria bacterium]|nr:hypothetical protein [Candidatus Parcubacteria bacterium]
MIYKDDDLLLLIKNFMRKFNCFVFAFGLYKYNDFVVGKGKNYSLNGVWVGNKIIELEKTEEPEKGDFIFYKNSEKEIMITHAGIFESIGMIKSQWGTDEPKIHKIEEAFDNYGKNYFFCKYKTPEEIRKLFVPFDL